MCILLVNTNLLFTVSTRKTVWIFCISLNIKSYLSILGDSMRIIEISWLNDHRVINFTILINLFLVFSAWWGSELSVLISVHCFPFLRTFLHLYLWNLIESLSLVLFFANLKIIRNVPNQCIFDILAEIFWRPSPAELGSPKLLLINCLGQVELHNLLRRPLSRR